MTREQILAAIRERIRQQEEFIHAQSGFYVQYEDQGRTHTTIQALRSVVDFIELGKWS